MSAVGANSDVGPTSYWTVTSSPAPPLYQWFTANAAVPTGPSRLSSPVEIAISGGKQDDSRQPAIPMALHTRR